MHRVRDSFDHSRSEIEDSGTGGARPVDRTVRVVTAGGHVDRLDRHAGGQRSGQQLDALDDDDTFGPPQAGLAEQRPQALDPLVGGGQAALAQEAASSAARGARSASFATCTRVENASGSVTARSASTLRSTSTPARCSPAMNLL